MVFLIFNKKVDDANWEKLKFDMFSKTDSQLSTLKFQNVSFLSESAIDEILNFFSSNNALYVSKVVIYDTTFASISMIEKIGILCGKFKKLSLFDCRFNGFSKIQMNALLANLESCDLDRLNVEGNDIDEELYPVFTKLIINGLLELSMDNSRLTSMICNFVANNSHWISLSRIPSLNQDPLFQLCQKHPTHQSFQSKGRILDSEAQSIFEKNITAMPANRGWGLDLKTLCRVMSVLDSDIAQEKSVPVLIWKRNSKSFTVRDCFARWGPFCFTEPSNPANDIETQRACSVIASPVNINDPRLKFLFEYGFSNQQKSSANDRSQAHQSRKKVQSQVPSNGISTNDTLDSSAVANLSIYPAQQITNNLLPPAFLTSMQNSADTNNASIELHHAITLEPLFNVQSAIGVPTLSPSANPNIPPTLPTGLPLGCYVKAEPPCVGEFVLYAADSTTDKASDSLFSKRNSSPSFCIGVVIAIEGSNMMGHVLDLFKNDSSAMNAVRIDIRQLRRFIFCMGHAQQKLHSDCVPGDPTTFMDEVKYLVPDLHSLTPVNLRTVPGFSNKHGPYKLPLITPQAIFTSKNLPINLLDGSILRHPRELAAGVPSAVKSSADVGWTTERLGFGLKGLRAERMNAALNACGLNPLIVQATRNMMSELLRMRLAPNLLAVASYCMKSLVAGGGDASKSRPEILDVSFQKQIMKMPSSILVNKPISIVDLYTVVRTCIQDVLGSAMKDVTKLESIFTVYTCGNLADSSEDEQKTIPGVSGSSGPANSSAYLPVSFGQGDNQISMAKLLNSGSLQKSPPPSAAPSFPEVSEFLSSRERSLSRPRYDIDRNRALNQYQLVFEGTKEAPPTVSKIPGEASSVELKKYGDIDEFYFQECNDGQVKLVRSQPGLDLNGVSTFIDANGRLAVDCGKSGVRRYSNLTELISDPLNPLLECMKATVSSANLLKILSTRRDGKFPVLSKFDCPPDLRWMPSVAPSLFSSPNVTVDIIRKKKSASNTPPSSLFSASVISNKNVSHISSNSKNKSGLVKNKGEEDEEPAASCTTDILSQPLWRRVPNGGQILPPSEDNLAPAFISAIHQDQVKSSMSYLSHAAASSILQHDSPTENEPTWSQITSVLRRLAKAGFASFLDVEKGAFLDFSSLSQPDAFDLPGLRLLLETRLRTPSPGETSRDSNNLGDDAFANLGEDKSKTLFDHNTKVRVDDRKKIGKADSQGEIERLLMRAMAYTPSLQDEKISWIEKSLANCGSSMSSLVGEFCAAFNLDSQGVLREKIRSLQFASSEGLNIGKNAKSTSEKGAKTENETSINTEKEIEKATLALLLIMSQACMEGKFKPEWSEELISVGHTLRAGNILDKKRIRLRSCDVLKDVLGINVKKRGKLL